MMRYYANGITWMKLTAIMARALFLPFGLGDKIANDAGLLLKNKH